MMQYSRQNFRAILNRLNPARPLGGTTCPIGVCFQTNSYIACEWDTDLALAIDAYRDETKQHWWDLTPREVLAVMDSVEARNLPAPYQGMDAVRQIIAANALLEAA